MCEDYIKYEKRLVKELEESKFFSWKRFWKTVELASFCSTIGH